MLAQSLFQLDQKVIQFFREHHHVTTPAGCLLPASPPVLRPSISLPLRPQLPVSIRLRRPRRAASD